MQLVRELSRVMENSIATELLDTWTELAPRIVQLARQEREDNPFIDQLLSLPEDPSNGEHACMHPLHFRCNFNYTIVNCTLAVTLYKVLVLYLLPILFLSIAADGDSVLAVCLLYHLLPDTRARPNLARIITLIEVTCHTTYSDSDAYGDGIWSCSFVACHACFVHFVHIPYIYGRKMWQEFLLAGC